MTTTKTAKPKKPAPAPAPDPAEHQAAKPPSSGGNSTITWGLISIPVKLFTGLEGQAMVKRSMFTPEGHPIGSRSYDKETFATYEGPVVKKTEVEKDVWVDLTDEEIEAVIGETVPAGLLEIESFVPLDMIGKEYVVEKHDQIRPAPRKVGTKNLPNEAADKAFSLLMAAMAERGVAALVKMPRRGAFCYGAITPDGRFQYLLFAEQVRKDREMPEATHTEAELALGLQLIDSIGVSAPVLTDVTTAKVREYIEAKRAGGEIIVKTEAPEAPAPTIDLTAALAASLKVA